LKKITEKDRKKRRECRMKKITLVVIKDLTSGKKFIVEEIDKIIFLIQNRLASKS